MKRTTKTSRRKIGLWLIHLADFVEHHVVGHRWYALCDALVKSSWWGDHDCQHGCKWPRTRRGPQN